MKNINNKIWQMFVVLVLWILWKNDVSAWLSPYITPLSQCIIILFYFRAQSKWNYRGRVAYREENWVRKTYSRVSFKTVWFFPIWLLFCWLASDVTWHIVSYLYLAQLLLGINLPRIEYMMTKNTPAGWALREYARTEFSEEKLEREFYTQLYQPHLKYKKHEYYLWWLMQGEPWIFRIKAFSQFTRDVVFCILTLILVCILFILYLPIYVLWEPKFNADKLTVLDIFFTTYGWIVTIAWLFLSDNHYYRFNSWNYFFYYKRYPEAAGPRIENPGTWEYYYYIITGVFPKKYRDLHDLAEYNKLKKLGLLGIEFMTEEEEEAEDDVHGFSDPNINAYDAEGGLDIASDDEILSEEEEEDNESYAAATPQGKTEYRKTKTQKDAER